MKVKMRTNITLDVDELFSDLRDIYDDKQLARLAVKMGIGKGDPSSWLEALTQEACKASVRNGFESGDIDYENAVKIIASV